MVKNFCVPLLVFLLTACASAGSRIGGPRPDTIDPEAVRGLKPSDTIVLYHYTDSGDDLEVKIQAHHVLKGDGFESHILECSPDETIYVDLEDDRVFVSAVEKDLDLDTLGIGENKLDRIDTREKGSIVYQGQRFKYTDSDTATYYENGTEDETVYYWEFDAVGDDRALLVIYFEDDDAYAVELIEELDPDEISMNAAR